jgi:hypothetical protein
MSILRYLVKSRHSCHRISSGNVTGTGFDGKSKEVKYFLPQEDMTSFHVKKATQMK